MSLDPTIIGPELYSVGGVAPEQSVLFHTESSFNYFLILVIEFFAEGARNSLINDKFENWSLLKGLRWLCCRYPDEAKQSNLDQAISNIEDWIKRKVPFEFWCPEVNDTIRFQITNNQLISFGANTAKHHLFRLTELLGKLDNLCISAGYNFVEQQYPAILSSMIEEVKSRLQYHSSYLIELLGQTFLSLNRLIVARFDQNPTNRVMDMNIPAGVTSDVFRNLYGAVMVFKRYDEARILNHTPITTRYLKMRY